MNLLNIQRHMARAVMTPLTRSQRMSHVASDGRSQRAVANGIIKPNDHLTSFERLEIYNRQYWFRVLSGFSEDFPGLRAVLGTRVFDKVAQGYLKDCPSRSFSMRNIGSQLEMWLRNHPHFAGPRQQLALDMARLEWAEINAFDGKRYDPLKPEDLADTNPATLRLQLQPHLSLLDLNYPVDDLLLRVRKDSTEGSIASNALGERHKGKRSVSVVPLLKHIPIFLAVHRMDEDVYFRRLEQKEFAILSCLRNGKSLGAAIEGVLRQNAMPDDESLLLTQKWFQNWSALGWFYPGTTVSTSS
jgi:putative DNA-binding protein